MWPPTLTCRVGSLLLDVSFTARVHAKSSPSDAASPEHQDFRDAARAEAQALWDSVLQVSRPALVSAYAHAGGCSCDIGDALRAMAEARERGQA